MWLNNVGIVGGLLIGLPKPRELSFKKALFLAVSFLDKKRAAKKSDSFNIKFLWFKKELFIFFGGYLNHSICSFFTIFFNSRVSL